MNVSDHKCPNCDAVLKFDPITGKWKCEYCASIFSLEEVDTFHKNRKDTEKESSKKDFSSYKCPDCGAEIVMDDETTATFCVYCGNTAIIKNKMQGEFAPSKVIPFKTTKEQAIQKFTEYNKGKLFIPNEFTNKNNIEKISGIYIPFFIYDCEADADINVSASKVSTWSDSRYDYTKKDTYNVETAGTMHFENIPVDGSTRFPNDIMNSIEPFLYNDLTDFNPSYLSGFLSERYDTSIDELFEIAKARATSTANTSLLNTITGYTFKTIKNSNTKITKNNTSEYVLLPVWMLNVKYKEKFYTLAMNGQTGKFVGNVPIDKRKVAKYWFGITGGFSFASIAIAVLLGIIL